MSRSMESDLDNRNVADRFKGWATDLIKNELSCHNTGLSVCMINIERDFNFASIVRSANNFGASSVYYVGPKQWDRRGSVGTHHYTDVVHLGKELKDLVSFMHSQDEDVQFIALENNISQQFGSTPIQTFRWPTNPIIITGSESEGISDSILELCDWIVEIPSFGSTRSLNVANASAIAMYDYVAKTQ